MKEVYSRIGMGLNDVRFIGIWGMGWLGKTTIARLVYEAIKEKFEANCFLQNIRENSEGTNGLVHIQKELLSSLGIRSTDFYNSYDGKKILANSLRNKKVPLVLDDDASELSQLESLVGKQEWFGPRSRVIITTRDKHLLGTHGVHEICQAMRLNNHEALELICCKAFKLNNPREEYLSLCEEVVQYTDGLPLALEVLGRYLNGRTVEVWRSALKEIKRNPRSEIQDKLKISFDNLQPVHQNLFLDIACFFKGRRENEVIDILENCGDHPKIGIEILMERSLVTRGIDWCGRLTLEMHDLLQEMGRNLVIQESPNDPGNRSRLWSHEDIKQALGKDKGSDKIQSIVHRGYLKPGVYWSPEVFSKTSQIRLLKLNFHPSYFCGLNCFPSALKVLHWNCYTSKTLPLRNPLDEIVDLRLHFSKIEQLWHGTKYFGKLKSIDLSFSRKLKLSPDIDGIPNLESLVLVCCRNLTEVHPSLLCHKKLVRMNLKGCTNLTGFPCKMEMSSLKYLNLGGCYKFTYLQEFGKSMKNLSELSLEWTAIMTLPSSLGCLVGLTKLNLGNCKNLDCLPDTIGELKFLLILNVFGCSKLWFLPESLKECKFLKELHANETAIEELPLSVLYLKNAEKMSFAKTNWPLWIGPFRLPPSTSCLCSLRVIDLGNCNLSEESMPDDFFELPSLIDSDLSGNNFVRLPSSISKLANLEYLHLNGCKILQQLPELPSSIQKLDACNCRSLDISNFIPSTILGPPRTTGFLPYGESVISSKGSHLPKVIFDMLISGSETPWWFFLGYDDVTESYDFQATDNIARICLRHNCLPAECVGFAFCIQLGIPDLKTRKINGYLAGPEGWVPIHSRSLLPWWESLHYYLYVFYLSIEECHDKFLEGDQIDFVFGFGSESGDVEILNHGWRLVRRQDVEDIYKHRFWDMSIHCKRKYTCIEDVKDCHNFK